MQEMEETQVRFPELGRFPGVGNGNPLQYLCLENSMDRGALQAIVHGITMSRTRLRLNTHTKCLVVKINILINYFKNQITAKLCDK